MKPQEQKALAALQYILPFLKKYNFKWVITGGFACYVYGVKRTLTDIDIDIDTSKDSPEFKALIEDIKECTTQPLEHFVDQNYENYNLEIAVDKVIVDICPMKEMNVFNKETGRYEHFYKEGFPAFETMDFRGLELFLLSKELIVKNKKMLMWKRESDLKDIECLQKMIDEKSA